jgi:hypothetical protein
MPTCLGSSCSFECNPGRLLCQGQCAACATPANAFPSCSGAACDFECNSGFERVGNACLRIATWQLNSAATGPQGRYGAPMSVAETEATVSGAFETLKAWRLATREALAA